MKTPCVVLVEEQLRNISVSLRHSHWENKKGRGGGEGLKRQLYNSSRIYRSKDN